jgi:putative thioredoxin
MTAHVVDVDKTNFDAVVVEGSKRVPVVVDFWAPWCGPCRTLGPILEKLADEYGGRFMLAKINSDENPELSAKYGVRGIPNVKAFSGGEVIDEFTGALPESGVRQFLDRIIPSPADELRDEAAHVYAQTHDADQALAVLDQAEARDPGNQDVQIDRAAILADAGRHAEARQAIATLKPLTQLDDRVSALQSKLDLAEGAAEAPDQAALEQRLAANENDLEARLQLAHLKTAQKDYRSALEHLLAIVERDRAFRDDIGRKTMLKIFELLGSGNEIVSEFRKRLARAMN